MLVCPNCGVSLEWTPEVIALSELFTKRKKLNENAIPHRAETEG